MKKEMKAYRFTVEAGSEVDKKLESIPRSLRGEYIGFAIQNLMQSNPFINEAQKKEEEAERKEEKTKETAGLRKAVGGLSHTFG